MARKDQRQVWVDRDVADDIGEIASAIGRTQAEVIRAAVNGFYKDMLNDLKAIREARERIEKAVNEDADEDKIAAA